MSKLFKVHSDELKRSWWVQADDKRQAITEVLFFLRHELAALDRQQEEDVDLGLRIQELQGPVIEVQ